MITNLHSDLGRFLAVASENWMNGRLLTGSRHWAVRQSGATTTAIESSRTYGLLSQRTKEKCLNCILLLEVHVGVSFFFCPRDTRCVLDLNMEHFTIYIGSVIWPGRMCRESRRLCRQVRWGIPRTGFFQYQIDSRSVDVADMADDSILEMPSRGEFRVANLVFYGVIVPESLTRASHATIKDAPFPQSSLVSARHLVGDDVAQNIRAWCQCAFLWRGI